MFWRKKQAATVPVSTVETGVMPPTTELVAPPQHNVERVKVEKLPGPRSIEELVGRQLVGELKQNPDWVWRLRSVARRRAEGKHRFDFRVFDEAQLAEKRVKVKDYTSFDNCTELVLYQGWFDKVSMRVHFEEKKPA